MDILVKFYWSCGRMGDLSGLFITTEQDLNDAIGKSVYFGEVLGKHSNIFGDLDEDDLTIISNDQDLIKNLRKEFTTATGWDGATLCGYNPLSYLEDEDD